MKEGEFYKMDFRAWNVGTVDLTLEQEAAFLRICHAMSDARGPIPNSGRLLRGIFRCGNTKASALVRQLIDAGKIQVTETGALSNRRVTDELAKRDRRSTEQSANGKRGGTASGAARKKANEIKDDDEAHASTQRSREEESREEKSRVDEIEDTASAPMIEDEVLPWDIPQADPKPEPKPDPKPKSAKDYAIDQSPIRLTYDDLERWQKLYTAINVAGEVTGMVGWLTEKAREGKNWFQVAQGALAKRDRDRRKEVEAHRITAEANARHGAAKAAAPRRMAI